MRSDRRRWDSFSMDITDLLGCRAPSRRVFSGVAPACCCLDHYRLHSGFGRFRSSVDRSGEDDRRVEKDKDRIQVYMTCRLSSDH